MIANLADGLASGNLSNDKWLNGLAREKQKYPKGEDWRIWLVLAGRGWGKTRTAAETVRLFVKQRKARQIALIGRTAGDVRDVMVTGPLSGLLEVCREAGDEVPVYEPSNRRLVWRKNGAIAHTYSADKPDMLRGPQHDLVWADELAAWRYLRTWDMAMLGLRIGKSPRAIVTTTPRPIQLLKDLVSLPYVCTTKGTTYENEKNLSAFAIDKLRSQYENTRLGRQELYAELLEDVEGSLWPIELIESSKVAEAPESLARVIVSIDPAITAKSRSNETGIIVVGLSQSGIGYVLADYSGKYAPDQWARKALAAYIKHKADCIVAEVNQGGDMVEQIIGQATLGPVSGKSVSVRKVSASRGKVTRAEPVAALYEQGRVKHVGQWPELEDQMATFAYDILSGQSASERKSPDRVDALVWGLTYLMVDVAPIPRITIL